MALTIDAGFTLRLKSCLVELYSRLFVAHWLWSIRDFTDAYGWTYGLWTPPGSFPQVQCVIPVIQASNWSKPSSIVPLAGSHGGSVRPLAPGHCFWSYSTGFKKRWKLSITRWMDAHQRECINQYAGEAVFFFPNSKSSSCILLGFQILCSAAGASEEAGQISLVRQSYHKQLWATTTLCHLVWDPRERC